MPRGGLNDDALSIRRRLGDAKVIRRAVSVRIPSKCFHAIKELSVILGNNGGLSPYACDIHAGSMTGGGLQRIDRSTGKVMSIERNEARDRTRTTTMSIEHRAQCRRQHARRAGQITGISWQMIPRVLQ